MAAARILVVDDEPDVLETLAAGLRRGGFEVTTLQRFVEAKHLIDADPPDGLVTDVRLGPYNGLQLALHMRQVRPNAPIIVLSGFDDALLRKEAATLGGAYYTKPVPSEVMVTYLSDGLRR